MASQLYGGQVGATSGTARSDTLGLLMRDVHQLGIKVMALAAESTARVETGATFAAQTGQTMHQIVESVQRMTDIVNEIAAATEEQARGVDQVGQAVGELDHATARNAALVEESAATTTSLRDQAERLAQAVAVFRMHR